MCVCGTPTFVEFTKTLQMLTGECMQWVYISSRLVCANISLETLSALSVPFVLVVLASQCYHWSLLVGFSCVGLVTTVFPVVR